MFPDLTLNVHLVKDGDIVLVRKAETSEEDFWIGVIKSTSTTNVTVQWLVESMEEGWHITTDYKAEKIQRKTLLAIVKSWKDAGEMPDGLRDQIKYVYAERVDAVINLMITAPTRT